MPVRHDRVKGKSTISFGSETLEVTDIEIVPNTPLIYEAMTAVNGHIIRIRGDDRVAVIEEARAMIRAAIEAPPR